MKAFLTFLLTRYFHRQRSTPDADPVICEAYFHNEDRPLQSVYLER